MKSITAPGGPYLTGDSIADAVLRYALVLARARELDRVDIPCLDAEGRVRRVELIIGWRCWIAAIADPSAVAELVEPETVDALVVRAAAVGSVLGHAFSDEERAGLDRQIVDAGVEL